MLPEGNGPTYICKARCSPGAACVPSWFPPGCTWWQRNGRRSRRSCCRCRRPAWDGEVPCEGHVSPGSAPKRGVQLVPQGRKHLLGHHQQRPGEDLPPWLCPALKPAVSQKGPSPSPSLRPHLLEDSRGGRAAGGVLAHAHGRVVVVHLAHLAVLAVVVLAGVWERAGGKVRGCPVPTSRKLASPRGSQHRGRQRQHRGCAEHPSLHGEYVRMSRSPHQPSDYSWAPFCSHALQ